MKAARLRLILGDQLNPKHSWFAHSDPQVLYLMIEMRQETDYVLHHAQKILGIFAAMRDFAGQLREQGHRVYYLKISDPNNTQTLIGNLEQVIEQSGCQHMEYQAPDEWRLDQQLSKFAADSPIDVECVDSEHFYTRRDEVARLFAKRKRWLMESFYRQMRQQHQILLDANGEPEGGQWNYDHDNRHAWRGDPEPPADCRPLHDHSQLWKEIVESGASSFGNPQAEQFRWPLNRDQALELLASFIDQALPHFGRYQDAANTGHWRLFHSLISFALNTKMINPRELVQAAQQAYRERQIPLAAAEGFIRQVIGWREYVRGVYWAQMPGYDKQNFFAHEQPLPHWFWDGNTRMRCLRHAIGQSLEHAYAHHIQRLMIIGNFALLAGLSPQELHRWYLGIYIDAFEWVELPNTLGMSQFADGGLLATKPYVSSAAYVHRMSDYCQQCHYQRAQRTGARACPFNALYWDFHLRHRDRLEGNPRIGMAYRNLQKMDTQTREALVEQANAIRRRLDQL
ncbi:MAG: cryptochrome/photolyase family protein [Xanthomonadales bacterium]|nr:cryptochrome/photolyase family protein [Xanthomonadales bacterium]